MSQKEHACAHKIVPRARNYDLNCTRTTLTAEHKSGDRCISCRQNTGCEKLYLCIFTTKFDRKWWFQALTEEFDSSHKLNNLDDFFRSGNIPTFFCENESEWPLYQLQLHVATPTPGKSTKLAHLANAMPCQHQQCWAKTVSMFKILCFTLPSASSVDLYVTKPAKPAPLPKSTTKVQWHVGTIATATILFELIFGISCISQGTMSKQNDWIPASIVIGFHIWCKL